MATARVALVLAGHCLVIHRPHLSSTSIVHVHRPSLPRGETPSSKAMKETTTTAPRASASTPAATNSNKTTAAIPATNKADRYEEPRPFSSNEREARGITGRPLSAFDQFKRTSSSGGMNHHYILTMIGREERSRCWSLR